LRIERRGGKGSLTLEAAIALPLLAVFLVAATLSIRVLTVRSAFERSVSRSAAALAGSVYPLTFLNALADEVAMGGGEAQAGAEEAAEAAGVPGGGDPGDLFELLRDLLPGLDGLLPREDLDRLAGSFGRAKSALAEEAVRGMMVEDSGGLLQTGRIRFVMLELPASVTEYAAKCRDPAFAERCRAVGYTPDIADVALCVEYVQEVAIPFLGTRTVVFRSLAVERGWVEGTHDIGSLLDTLRAAAGEGTQDPGRTVFVTRTGVRYHRDGCMYLRLSRIPVELGEAVRMGYSPCKVCRP
jgi:hypothetical protein